jgi:hypothetical protein
MISEVTALPPFPHTPLPSWCDVELSTGKLILYFTDDKTDGHPYSALVYALNSKKTQAYLRTPSTGEGMEVLLISSTVTGG